MKKILYINLKSKKIKIMNQYNEYKVNLKNDSLVFEAPILAGYGIIGLNKLSVYNKNSLSQSGTHFTHFMKCNGYDYLVFEGESDTPVYIYIDKEHVSIKEAPHLYQADYHKFNELVAEELEIDHIEIASIGKASANGIDFSKIMFRNNKSCGKDGLGKLMGEKKLKAIVLKKHETLIPHNGQELNKYNRLIKSKISNNPNNWYDENNKCYGCNLNCQNTSIDKIQNLGFEINDATKINDLADLYGMDSITLAKGINTYEKTFDIQIVELDLFVQDIMKNYEYYKPIFSNINQSQNNKNKDKSGFCKLLMQKKILNEKDKINLSKSILGFSIDI